MLFFEQKLCTDVNNGVFINNSIHILTILLLVTYVRSPIKHSLCISGENHFLNIRNQHFTKITGSSSPWWIANKAIKHQFKAHDPKSSNNLVNFPYTFEDPHFLQEADGNKMKWIFRNFVPFVCSMSGIYKGISQFRIKNIIVVYVGACLNNIRLFVIKNQFLCKSF